VIFIDNLVLPHPEPWKATEWTYKGRTFRLVLTVGVKFVIEHVTRDSLGFPKWEILHTYEINGIEEFSNDHVDLLTTAIISLVNDKLEHVC